MSWLDDVVVEPDETVDPEETQETVAGAEDAFDPADLDESTRTRVDEYLAAERAKDQKKLEQDRGRFGKGVGDFLTDLRSKGLDRSSDNKVLIRDAQLAAKALGITVAEAREMQREQAPPEEDIPDEMLPQSWDEPEDVKRKYRALVRTIGGAAAKAAAEAAVAPLREENARLRGAFAQQQVPNVFSAAKSELEKIGLGHVADTEEYRQAMAATLEGVPPENWPGLMKAASFQALSRLDTIPTPKQEPRTPENPRARTSAAARDALGSSGLNGGGNRRSEAPEIPAEIRELVAINKAAGIDCSAEDLYAAMTSPDTVTGRSHYRDLIDKRAAAGARR